MFKEWIKAKKAELKVKAVIYCAVADFIDSREAIVKTAQSLYNALKDVPFDELRSEFINKTAELIYENINKKAQPEE